MADDLKDRLKAERIGTLITYLIAWFELPNHKKTFRTQRELKDMIAAFRKEWPAKPSALVAVDKALDAAETTKTTSD